jgi:hypothetical protein
MAKQFTSGPAGQEQERPLAGLSFELDGETFTCDGTVRVFRLSAMTRAARAGDQEAMAAIMAESLFMALGADEYARFYEHTNTHDTPDETVIDIMTWLNEQAEEKAGEQAGRPTRRRPSSPGGPQDQGERMSRVISLASGDVQVVKDEKPKTARSRGKRTA